MLAADAIRSDWQATPHADRRDGLPPPARGSLAVLVNPGAWVFLSVVASPLLATAGQLGGRANALSTALALMIGAGIGDCALVVVAGTGLRRASPGVGRWIGRALALTLALLGGWLLLSGVLS
jgi:threonine/homoserine/homoserine lactone efflux protein